MHSEFQLLVKDCLAGRQIAMRDLVGQFQSRVFGLCLRMLGHHHDAEDATQETFVRVLRNLHRWDPDRDFEPWLMTIAGNRCRSRLTKRANHPAVQLFDYPISDATQLEQSGRQLAEELDLALRDLRSDYRECFEMFHQHELAYGEIAERLDVPLGTVKTWVHRARKEIINRLQARGVIVHDAN